jgi:hypothetical protein
MWWQNFSTAFSMEPEFMSFGTAYRRTAGLNEPAIDKEKKIATARGDHFAPGGDNDRLWIVEYYANKLLQVCCMAWYMDAFPTISVGSPSLWRAKLAGDQSTKSRHRSTS